MSGGMRFSVNGLRHSSSFTAVPNYWPRVRPYLQIEEIRPDVYQSSHLTTNIQGGVHRAYGGLIFAQAIAAAEKTVPDWAYPHSTHAFFIQNGDHLPILLQYTMVSVDTKAPIEYHIRRSRDGSSFFTRSVEAIQEGDVVFTAQASFNKEEPHSIRHQVLMPPVTPWSQIPRLKHSLPDMKKLIENGEQSPLPNSPISDKNPVSKGFSKWIDQYVSSNELFDVRLVQPDRAQPHHHRYWFRAAGELPDCDRTHRFLFAYITDSVSFVSSSLKSPIQVMSMSAIRSHLLVNSFAPSMMFSLDNSTWSVSSPPLPTLLQVPRAPPPCRPVVPHRS